MVTYEARRRAYIRQRPYHSSWPAFEDCESDALMIRILETFARAEETALLRLASTRSGFIVRNHRAYDPGQDRKKLAANDKD